MDNPGPWCPAPYKGAPVQVGRAVTHPISSSFLSDRGCKPKLGKLNCSLQAAAYSPVCYDTPKHPELKMTVVQGDFLAVSPLALKVPHVRWDRKGQQLGEAYGALGGTANCELKLYGFTRSSSLGSTSPRLQPRDPSSLAQLTGLMS